MVKVTPHRYVVDSFSRKVTDPPYGTVLKLYFVGDAKAGYHAWGTSWILRDQDPIDGRDPHFPGDGHRGTEVRATPDEVARWTEAQRTAEAALRDAETQLLRDYGLVALREGSTRLLRTGRRPMDILRSLRPCPSRRVSARFWRRVKDIDEAYQPVRKTIAARVREAQQQARERQQRAMALAARPWWSYRVDKDAGVVHVFHEEGATLDTTALADKLLEVRRETGVANLSWDDSAQEEITRASGMPFETWWYTVTPLLWTDSHTIPRTRVTGGGRTIHISAHTSFGIDTSSGFDTSPPSIHF